MLKLNIKNLKQSDLDVLVKYIDINRLSLDKNLGTEFINENLNDLNILNVFSSHPFPEEKIIEYVENKKLKIIDAFKVCKVSESFIEKYIDIYINNEYDESFIDRKNKKKWAWYLISENQNLSEEFISKHWRDVSWDVITKHQKLSEAFINKHKKLILWHLVPIYQVLSEKFIIKNIDKFDFAYILKYQNVSIEFIEKYITKINSADLWTYLSEYKDLSEEIIVKYKSKLNWYVISKNAKLSLDTIKKCSKYIYWDLLLENPNITEDIIYRNIKKYNEFDILKDYKFSEEYLDKIYNLYKYRYSAIDTGEFCYFVENYQSVSDEFKRKYNEKYEKLIKKENSNV